MSQLPDRTTLFQQWLEEHRGIVVKISRSFAPTPADSADLQQEMLLELWSALPSYNNGAKPSTWIYRVCLNTALTWKRGSSRREQRIDREADMSRLVATGASPAEQVGGQEVLEQLYTAIRAMPALERALVLLSLDGLSYREMAGVTGLSENHVGVVLTRARQRLTKLMEGVSDELD